MSRRTKLVGGLATVAVAALGLIPGIADSATGPAAATLAGNHGQQTWVTLITGDHVLVRAQGVLVDPAPRAGLAQFQRFSRRGDQYVLPTDAAALVRDGALDLELFNVTGLVRQGYDDARSANVPLLVRYAGTASAARAEAPDGATLRRRLQGMKALDEQKATAARFWVGTLTTTTGGGSRPGRHLTGGVQRVWLNGKVHATLDQSVPQIGAPVAWSHGLTGAGQTVAVLDSGIDAQHADFAGRIGATRDFTGKGTVEDGLGHGTHVASIVAGSGAAAGGKYKGVAPDATLDIGKVLDDSGNGSSDAVIAGMQWAAQSGARIVNMSLGGDPSDGTDPVSAAVNDLTREYGTLFVIAAGNFGGDETVAAPGAADQALTVASVSKSDVLSPFSSRGPRLGDGALKPDLAAPGADIVAARAAGAPLLGDAAGDGYQRLSGTSMATPHVAGSAALLAQQHPDWRADQLKAGLTSSAAEVPGASPYAVGTGRVDVARATAQAVTATGSVSTHLPWPNLGTSKKSAVTWRNAGRDPVTLTLSASLTGAPAGLLTVSADTVTVPAGGEASVEITATAQEGRAGKYPGILTAGSADGTVRTRTALSVDQEEEHHDLTVNLIDRNGNPAPAGQLTSYTYVDLDNPFNSGSMAPGETVRLSRGRYVIDGSIATPRPGQEPTVSLITYPELNLDHDTVQSLDARVGKPMSITTDNPAARGGVQEIEMLSKLSECASCGYSVITAVDPRFYQIYAGTVPGTSSPDFSFAQARRAEEPTLELYAQTAQPFEVPAYWLTDALPDQQATLPAVDGGAGTPDDLAKIDATGKLVLLAIPEGSPWDAVLERIAAVKDAGGKLVMLIPSGPASAGAAGGGGPTPAEPALPVMYGSGPTVARFLELVKAGGARASYVDRQFPSQRYELMYGGQAKLTTAQVHQAKTRDLVAIHSGYYDNVAGAGHSVMAAAEFAGREVGVTSFTPVRAGQERTEYFTPGTWDLWEQAGPSNIAQEVLSLRSGHRYDIRWNKAVTGPSFRGTNSSRPWAWRKDNVVDVTLPMFGDSAGRPRLADGASGSISLYRDGDLVDSVAAPDAAAFSVPAAPAAYRLVATADRTAAWWPLATKVTAGWTFHSSTADDAKALPLLTVRFDPAVDLRNRAVGDQAFSFPAYVTRQGTDSVAVTSLTVDVSYDDGQSWRPAAVTADGDHWQVSVEHPAGGYASLRAKATDADANMVEQSVIRAYEISHG